MLADAEDVAVGVFEPGYFAAVGRGPDTEVLVLHEGIFLRGNATVSEPDRDGLDVFDLPSQNGALQRLEIRHFGNANHVAADGHDQGKLIQAYELKSKLAFVEGARFAVVRRGDKADHLC